MCRRRARTVHTHTHTYRRDLRRSHAKFTIISPGRQKDRRARFTAPQAREIHSKTRVYIYLSLCLRLAPRGTTRAF